MSDFVQTMKDWRRMCSAMRSCDECPLNEVKCWAESPSDLIDSFEKRESVITEWAADHQESVYPTWGEWFAEQGELSANWKDLRVVSCSGKSSAGIIGLFYNQIPADIAQKLGIEPKEG